MKIARALKQLTRVMAWTLMALVLLVFGTVVMLYSSWVQEGLREAVLNKFNSPEFAIRLDRFSLRFPFRLEADGLALIARGDTAVAARKLSADVSLLPLLAAKVNVSNVEAMGVRYNMGAPDSAMYMCIAADSIALEPVSVHLSDMAIELSDGIIRGGKLSMTMNKDTTPPQKPAPPQKMSISLGRVRLDDFTYTMRMLPTIDTLSAHIESSELRDGLVDMYTQSISLKKFDGEGLSARYLTPDSITLASLPPQPAPQAVPDSLVAPPWTVAIDTISFTGSDALYAVVGGKPLPGLDFAYIAVDSLDLRINDFYNRQTTVRVPLALSGRERCGVSLDLDGELDIDSVALTFKKVNLTTPRGTAVEFDGLMGMGDMATDPTLPLRLNLDGRFAPKDLADMFPAFLPYLAAIPRADDILLNTDVNGTTGHLDIRSLALKLNGCVSLDADGFVENFMDPDRLGGNIALNGRIDNVNSFKNALLEPAAAKTLTIPPMTLNGNVRMSSGTVLGNLVAATHRGHIGLDARWNSKREAYNANIKSVAFPVQAFMPLLGLENVTAQLAVNGHGYSPFRKTTAMDASATINSATYQGSTYTDIRAKAQLKDGIADISLESDNDAADLSLKASGNLSGDAYTWHASLDGRYIDLHALKIMTAPASVEITLTADATIGPGKQDVAGTVNIGDLFFRDTSGTIGVHNLSADMTANDSTVFASLRNGDMTANFSTPASLDSLMAGFTRVGAIAAHQMENYSIDIDTLSRAMPQFKLDVRGGSNNVVNNILAPQKMSLKSFSLRVARDSILYLNGNVNRFKTGDMTLDSIFISGHEHERHLHLDAGLKNRPGNMDELHLVTVKAATQDSIISMRLHQENIKEKTGFDIGMVATASAADSTITLNIKPVDPIIGYKDWTVNDDNFISYTIPTQHVDAKLYMTGANSALSIYTEETAGHDTHGHNQEDLVIKLTDIQVQDWIAVNPFAPPMKGDVNADVRLNRHDGRLVGSGSASIANFFYGKEKVADFRADFNVAAAVSGTINAKADVFVDGRKTMTLSGALNDSTAISPLDLDFSVIHFPLAAANPFLPRSLGRLSGMLNGSLRISGTQEKPIMNGTIDFDSTAVRFAMTGTPYKFSETPVTVTDNKVDFKDFSITGCNANPLLVNGTVDISDMADMKMNLSLKADNMMIVNSKRPAKGADIFGKGYISLDANAHGSMRFLQVNANVSVNSNTDITYVMPDATSALTNRSTDDMVKFVNFNDSAAVAKADSIANTGLALMLDAELTMQEGSVVNVYLSGDGGNRLQLQTNGTLTYTMTPVDNDGRLTGRLNIDKGYIRYTPPVLSEFYFTFQNTSYVSFTGNMMDPMLNIHAVDVKRANVTGEGQNSRLVNFNVLLGVTGTLSQMDVKFDLATNDDMTVANELETMSPEQRANQAMNMLLYNVYTGPGTKANSALAGNPLFSFLESKINTWAANTIKGVDLSFGIDQYDRTLNGNTSQTMSYSYQVSKALFNDRFKIAVGGNYSTDANADENFSQNLINDISFEYFINDAHTMYVRLFRHTGYESILEGEITQTGVGFVYRRKLRRVGDMFLPVKYVNRRIARENEKLENKQTDKAK